MSAPDPAKKLYALLKKLRAEHGEPCPDADCDGCAEGADRLLWRLVHAFLTWEASPVKATAANKRLHASVIDYNEMRVCLADELAAMIGDRYPRALDRATRLRSTLNDLYRREHAVTLEPVVALGKREARDYLDSLEGLPPFVSARISLLALGGHAFPLDERLHQVLLEEEAVPEDATMPEVASWLERHFRAGEALPAYLLLEVSMNDRPPPKPAKKPVVRVEAKSKEVVERSKAGARSKRAAKP